LLSCINENILKYFGSDIHKADSSHSEKLPPVFGEPVKSSKLLSNASNFFMPFGTDEYWLITEYHSCGSLSDYLRKNFLDWTQMIYFANSILDGLAYLHCENSEIRKNFVIAHRDLKSKNILVKNNGASCCIADFGLALKLTSNTKLSSAEIRSKVGTRRYMSPELLEGAISFSKETFLRMLFLLVILFFVVVFVLTLYHFLLSKFRHFKVLMFTHVHLYCGR
jgi:serine/threonine protein kinase